MPLKRMPDTVSLFPFLVSHQEPDKVVSHRVRKIPWIVVLGIEAQPDGLNRAL